MSAIVPGARVENTVSASSVTDVATTALTVAAGDLVLVALVIKRTNPTVSDDLGNTWNAYISSGLGLDNGDALYVYWAIMAAGGSNVFRSHHALGSTDFAISARIFNGVTWAADPTDGRSDNVGNSTSPDSAAITITGTDDVIFGVVQATGDTLSDRGGFTVTPFSGAAGALFADAYKLVTVSESAKATCASGTWGIRGTAFKAPLPPPPVVVGETAPRLTQEGLSTTAPSRLGDSP